MSAAPERAKYPLQGTVTKALRRDVGITAVNDDYNSRGWRVRGGGTYPVAIYPDLHDTMNNQRDVRDVALLAETLTGIGWRVTAKDDRVVVHHVPTKAEVTRVGGNIAHAQRVVAERLSGTNLHAARRAAAEQAAVMGEGERARAILDTLADLPEE